MGRQRRAFFKGQKSLFFENGSHGDRGGGTRTRAPYQEGVSPASYRKGEWKKSNWGGRPALQAAGQGYNTFLRVSDAAPTIAAILYYGNGRGKTLGEPRIKIWVTHSAKGSVQVTEV